MENALAQECKAGASIRHSFDELNPAHLTFSLPVVVRARQSGQDSYFVPLQAFCEALEFLDLTCGYLCDPSVELFSLQRVHDVCPCSGRIYVH